MAKFIKTYELHVGDWVRFRTLFGKEEMQGRVQDISQLPDVFVEVGDPRMDNYNRYRISVKLIDYVYNADDFWTSEEVIFEPKEAVEFVYSEDFKERVYTHLEK